MASRRKVISYLSVFRHISRNVGQCVNKQWPVTAVKTNQKHILTPIPRRFCTAADPVPNDLEAQLTSGSLVQAMAATNKDTDVYLFGIPFHITTSDIEKAFEGMGVETVCRIDSRNIVRKLLYYIRFKNTDGQQKALQKQNIEVGGSVIETNVTSVGEPKLLAKVLTDSQATMIKVSNIPFDSTVKEIIQHFKPLEIEENDVFFLTRGACAIKLKNPTEVSEAQARSIRIGRRDLRIFPYMTEEVYSQLKVYLTK